MKLSPIFQTASVERTAEAEKIVIQNIKSSERNLKLWGTVVVKGSARAYAIIEEPGASPRRSKQFLHKPGDVVQGATIKKILREKVILRAEGKNEVLPLVEHKSSGRSRRIRPASTQPRRAPIRHNRIIRGSRIQKAIDSIDALPSQARVRPNSATLFYEFHGFECKIYIRIFEITDRIKLSAVLRSGCRLEVFDSLPNTGRQS